MPRLGIVFLPALVLLGLALAARGEGEEPREVARGRKLFADTQEGFYPACADCHNLLPPKEEAERAKHLGPGSTLYGAAVRQGWRNMNTFADVGEASQTCAKRYQERKRGLTAAQRADLVAFLRSRAPAGSLPRRKVQRKPKLLKAYDGGDAARGARHVTRYCGGCHAAAEDAISPELQPGRKRKAAIARKVRGYDAKLKFKPGTMSYYTNDRLTDGDLLDILAYLGR